MPPCHHRLCQQDKRYEVLRLTIEHDLSCSIVMRQHWQKKKNAACPPLVSYC